MAGLDVAFYKGRSRYHTKYDAVQYTLGGKKSLWSMMEVARGVGIGLLEAPYDDEPAVSDVKDDPVYFDCELSLTSSIANGQHFVLQCSERLWSYSRS